MSEPPHDVEFVPLSIVSLDDDPDYGDFIQSVLEDEGHEIRVASNQQRCMEYCGERLPDILLLDIKMGQESGEEVLRRIRERWPDLCVIIVTGYPTMETMRRTFKQDVFDYLAKPFSIEELRNVLRQASDAFDLGRRPQDRLRVELGKRIRLARTTRGWTLRELSDESGVSVSQLSSVERGAHMPSVESLLAVAHALRAKPSVWFEESGF
ncbi:MAG: response regulator [Phycisphaerales bacterium JB043]